MEKYISVYFSSKDHGVARVQVGYKVLDGGEARLDISAYPDTGI